MNRKRKICFAVVKLLILISLQPCFLLSLVLWSRMDVPFINSPWNLTDILYSYDLNYSVYCVNRYCFIITIGQLFGCAEDSFEEGKILQFLDYNKFPLVTVLTEFNSIRVHSSPIKVQVTISLPVFLIFIFFLSWNAMNYFIKRREKA